MLDLHVSINILDGALESSKNSGNYGQISDCICRHASNTETPLGTGLRATRGPWTMYFSLEQSTASLYFITPHKSHNNVSSYRKTHAHFILPLLPTSPFVFCLFVVPSSIQTFIFIFLSSPAFQYSSFPIVWIVILFYNVLSYLILLYSILCNSALFYRISPLLFFSIHFLSYSTQFYFILGNYFFFCIIKSSSNFFYLFYFIKLCFYLLNLTLFYFFLSVSIWFYSILHIFVLSFLI